MFTGRERLAPLGLSCGGVPRGRILIVEDDKDVRDALSEALAEAGLTVEVACDGVEGLERLRAGPPPSVILLDLRMPRLGGEELLRALRADPVHEHVPVISMTAGVGRLQDDEVVAHLHKPFDLDDLLGIVLSLCEPDARPVAR